MKKQSIEDIRKIFLSSEEFYLISCLKTSNEINRRYAYNQNL